MAAPASSSTEIAERTPQQELVSQVRSEEFRGQIAAALPGNLLPDRFQRATVTALMTNPDLADQAKCERGSLFNALMRAAQDGLLPDGREAAIATYKGKAQYLPMIGGYRKIAGDHGWQIAARVVYQNDDFEYEQGLEPKLRHIPVRPGVERGERIAAYAIAKHIDGSVAAPIVMYADEVAKRKEVAQTDRVWNTWTDRMWEKTVAKALFRELPIGELDERVARVIAAEETDPAQAQALLYGGTDTPRLEQPAADGRANGTESEPDQQAEAAERSTQTEAAASAPDHDGEPDIGGDEPEQKSIFQPPPDAQAAKDAADAAGRYTVDRGRANIKGKTIAEIAAQPKGADWLKWVIAETKDHPAAVYAKSYARVYLPETYQEAMALLQTATQ